MQPTLWQAQQRAQLPGQAARPAAQACLLSPPAIQPLSAWPAREHDLLLAIPSLLSASPAHLLMAFCPLLAPIGPRLLAISFFAFCFLPTWCTCQAGFSFWLPKQHGLLTLVPLHANAILPCRPHVPYVKLSPAQASTREGRSEC